MTVPMPPNEAERLAVVDALGIVGTPPEAVFDSIVELVAGLIGTPIALLSLVTSDAQWFKANVGLPDTPSTPRDVAFCAHAITQRDVLVVNDASADERFAQNPLVRGAPGIRFYAGAPLITSTGHALGTLCAIDREPRTLSSAQRATLQQLAAVVTALIEARADKQALAASEARLQTLFAAMSEGLVVQASDGRILDANLAAEAVLGLTRDELLGKKSVDPDWRAIREDGTPFPGDEHPAMVTLRTGNPVYRQIMGVRRASEVPRWLSINSEPVPNSGAKDAAAVLCTFVDVTAQRQAFERIRALAQRLESVREEERHAIAKTLHEGIAQDLFAMQLTLRSLDAESAGRTGVQQAGGRLAKLIGKSIADTRQIANDMQPAALAHLRLVAVLQDHARFFAAISGLHIDVTEIAPFPSLDTSTGLLFFRVAQEALTNVARHARAANVAIVLRTTPERICMDVTDDGVGVEAGAISKPGSLGLLGIQERVHAFGGGMTIEPADTRGTRLTLWVPA